MGTVFAVYLDRGPNTSKRIDATGEKIMAARSTLSLAAVLASSSLVAGLAIQPCHAQVAWAVDGTNVQLDAEGHSTGAFGVNPCDVVSGPLFGLAPVPGHDLGLENFANCDEITSCVLTADGYVSLTVDGVGTPVLRIRWDALSQVHHSCHTPRAYTGKGIANLTASLGLTPVGLPNGTPVTVHYLWRDASTNNYHPEAAAEDAPTFVSLTSLSVNGTNLFVPGFLDLVGIRGAGFLADIGQFNTTAGTTFLLNNTVQTEVNFTNPGNPPPPGTIPEDDDELTSYGGSIILSLVGPLIQDPANGEIDFSVDMGSDTCMAPMLPANGNEVFDPGDMYPMAGPPLPAGGQDGVRDDGSTFPGDPRPVTPGAPIADVCSGIAVPPADMTNLDVDGSESIDAATLGLIEAGSFPLNTGPSACVHRGDSLLLSFDDDTASHVYDGGTCSAPAASQSPSGMTYGSAAVQDELIGANIITLFNGVRLAVRYPVASESQVHTNLAANPPAWATPAMQAADDDVDALDERAASCGTWLFSVDHEGNLGLDPATIYRAAPGAPVPLILEGQFGIAVGTDVRDFELAITTDAGGSDVFTLLFTVSPDDPLTAGVNESAGLDPAKIYASYLNGSYFPYLSEPIPPHGLFGPAEAIDSLTTLLRPFAITSGDTDGDGVLDAADCAPANGSVWSAPGGPPVGMTIDHSPTTNVATLSWGPPASPGGTALVYDVYRAPLATPNALPPVFGCRAADVAGASFNDAVAPTPGSAWLYVTRAQTACGAGPVQTSGGGHVAAVPACP